jgi:AcrR family transcriptional regulator
VVRTKAEQGEHTRQALLDAARTLFTERGYSGAATEEIVRAAGITRGALYYHFRGKAELFAAVYEDLECQVAQRLGAAADAEPRRELHLEVGAQAFLDACLEPAVQRISLLDAPAVLGWEAWREIGARYGLALIGMGLEAGMGEGYYERMPVEPLAQLVLAALTEAGLAIALADDREAARAEMGAVLARLLDGLKPRPQR